NEELLGGVGPPIPEGEVVLFGAALIAVPLDSQPYFRPFGESTRVTHQCLAGIVSYVVFVEVKENILDSLRNKLLCAELGRRRRRYRRFFYGDSRRRLAPPARSPRHRVVGSGSRRRDGFAAGGLHISNSVVNRDRSRIGCIP